MGRLDGEIQPSGEVGSEYIYCRVWWQDPGGEGGAASDWRRVIFKVVGHRRAKNYGVTGCLCNCVAEII